MKGEKRKSPGNCFFSGGGNQAALSVSFWIAVRLPKKRETLG